MRCLRWTTLFVLLAVPRIAGAQIVNCGQIWNAHQAMQFADFRSVDLIVGTGREFADPILCNITLQSEGWVSGVGGASANTGNYYAEVRIIIPVPNYSTYTTNGKHWAIFNGSWWYYGTTVAPVSLTPPSPPKPPVMECEDNGGFWTEDPFGMGYCTDSFSPLLLDLDHTGLRLSAVEDGVLFDLDADGVPEQVSWPEETARGVAGAWLAFDRNGNGVIDNGAELWGNVTPVSHGIGAPTAANGFEALKFTESPTFGLGAPSVPDNLIDERDAIWPFLLVWRDANRNGISEPAELTQASLAGLEEIGTVYREARRRDRNGNEFRQRGSARANGRRLPVWDVWLKSQKR